MNTQKPLAIFGIILVILGLLITMYEGYRVTDIGLDRVIGLILDGLSIQLLGIGLITIGKKSS